jgi:hypothetical protein
LHGSLPYPSQVEGDTRAAQRQSRAPSTASERVPWKREFCGGETSRIKIGLCRHFLHGSENAAGEPGPPDLVARPPSSLSVRARGGVQRAPACSYLNLRRWNRTATISSWRLSPLARFAAGGLVVPSPRARRPRRRARHRHRRRRLRRRRARHRCRRRRLRPRRARTCEHQRAVRRRQLVREFTPQKFATARRGRSRASSERNSDRQTLLVWAN